MATDKNPLMTTLSCVLASLRVNRQQKSIMGIANGIEALVAISWTTGISGIFNGRLPIIIPMA
jgi:hypothetical protein